METYTEERPWGAFEQFTHNEQTTVKILTVRPGQLLSYQYHEHRSEFWRVLSGRGYVVIDEVRHEARPGDSFEVPQGARHRIGTEDLEMRVLEISFGTFDEEDNIRLEDAYGRDSPCTGP